MKLPREDLEEEVSKSKRILKAKKNIKLIEEKINQSIKDKDDNTNKILECNSEIRRLQGEIRKLGVLCQGINKRIGVYQGKIQRHYNSIRKEEKRIEQKLEDKWVERKRQEFRKSCYVSNLNI